MYFDNLTLISLVVFAIAFGSFVYACIIRGCLTDSGKDDTQDYSEPARSDRSDPKRARGD